MKDIVYAQDKTTILTNPDLTKGKIVKEQVFVKHHDEKEFYEQIPVFDNDGKITGYENGEYLGGQGAFDAYEYIKAYIPYTVDELNTIKEKKYKDKVKQLIQEKYDIDDELAIQRQKDTKTLEYQKYNNYCEECKRKAKKEIYK